MKNQAKGFSPKPEVIETQENEALRSEFEIMQRLDFVFIKELGVTSAEEYIIEVTNLKCSMGKRCDRGRKTA